MTFLVKGGHQNGWERDYQKLYHVVFSNDFRDVSILNNMLEPVAGALRIIKLWSLQKEVCQLFHQFFHSTVRGLLFFEEVSLPSYLVTGAVTTVDWHTQRGTRKDLTVPLSGLSTYLASMASITVKVFGWL